MNRGMQCVALIPEVHGFHWLFNVFSHMFLNRAGYGRDELRNSFVSGSLNRLNSLSKNVYVYRRAANSIICTLHAYTLNVAILVTVFVIDVCMLIFLKPTVKLCQQFFSTVNQKSISIYF